MLTSDFDYDLPDHLIAQHPAPRGESRMMVIAGNAPPQHRRIVDLPDLLERGDLLVVNDTRVIPARLTAKRHGTGGVVEVFLVEKTGEREWLCLTKPGRKTPPGQRLDLAPGLSAEVVEPRGDGKRLVRFSEPLEPHLDELGTVPLPPYIKRPAEPRDHREYQTIFAERPGAIAAPTAGLHFTDELVERLAELGVEIARLTLYVGVGTFKPVTAELVHEHRMDRERYEIPAATVERLLATRRRGGRIVAVGTTVVRTLEGAAASHGWPLPEGPGSTDLFIRPGHRFRVVEGLLTNFHLPRSTLLMLVAAFVGRERILDAYREAIAAGYRFFSYGDAMLLLPAAAR
ncbi:MAG: tRNA preQ1(34) S-adenosylmethionine ribosyltransferase-isomerase QueA [Thermoanaerobaculia bacterium]|nr:tRNA preQ1(34) S-adenosylmethionine ribosyltransferase-isomerase QueA [Thermoanaerobaculia bacterium]